MNSAPSKTRPQDLNNPSLANRAVPTSPALEAIQATIAKQDSDLSAAFASVARFADTQIAVNPALLEEIDEACTFRRASTPQLFVLTRC